MWIGHGLGKMNRGSLYKLLLREGGRRVVRLMTCPTMGTGADNNEIDNDVEPDGNKIVTIK